MSQFIKRDNTALLDKFERLLEIMDTLREKCPWDKKQTLQSLRLQTLEECYELSDAILENQAEDIIEELGDMLLHLLFYAKILSEQNPEQNIATIIQRLSQKLIRRHPHIYGSVKAEKAEEVSKNWEQIKQNQEKKPSILSGVPKSAPSIKKAIIIQKKAAAIGFDFKDEKEAWQKVNEELKELEAEKNIGDKQNELGDLLFSLINWSRKANLDPEYALEKTNQKFTQRFQSMEQQAKDKGGNLIDFSQEEMEDLWQQSKKEEIL